MRVGQAGQDGRLREVYDARAGVNQRRAAVEGADRFNAVVFNQDALVFEHAARAHVHEAARLDEDEGAFFTARARLRLCVGAAEREEGEQED